MTVRTVYSTNEGMTGTGAPVNPQGGAVAIGHGTDGLYSINVLTLPGYIRTGPPVDRPDGYTLVDREELRLIRDALDAELRYK